MAEIASLEVRLSLDSKKFNTGLKGAKSSLDKTAKATDSFQKDIRGAGNSLAKVGKEGRSAFSSIDTAAGNAKGSIGGLLTSLSGAGVALGGVTAVAGAVTAIGFAVASAAGEYSQGMRRMQATTGKTGEELKALGDTAIDVYRDTFGASISEATKAVSEVTRVLGETDEALATSSKNALVFRDVFDVDIPESLRAVRSGTEAFGRDSTEIFDMMAKTIQSVGDPSGDLADTINEYSADFAQAGFSAEQMFGILEAGVRNGARNFDVMADAVREFTIRIMDGSDTTKDALEQLFRATGSTGQEFFELKDRAVDLETAIKDNARALKDSEGAYKAQQSVVKGLQSELSDAKRELDALARPNLKGMEEFDNKLFELEQQSKRAQLALLDMEPDTDAYADTQSSLDRINNEIEKLSLQRDLVFDEQFRALEKAADAGTQKVISFEDALVGVASQKDKIAGLESSLALAQVDEGAAAEQVAQLAAHGKTLQAEAQSVADQIADMDDPVREFLDAIASGEMTAADAIFAVSKQLDGVEDKLLQEQIGVALLGPKWEELGSIITESIIEGEAGLQDFGNTMNEVADAAKGSGLGSVFEDLKKKMIGAVLQSEGFEQFMVKLGQLAAVVEPGLEIINSALQRLDVSLGGTGEGVDLINVAFAGLELILDAAITGVQLIAIAVDAGTNAFIALKEAISAIGSPLDYIGSKFGKLGDAVGNAWDLIPDALKPGSPPPFAIGLDKIRKSMDTMPSFDDAFGGSGKMALQSPLTSPGGGNTTSNVTVNIDGISATSVTSGDPNTEAIKMTIGLLTQALKAA
jgi:predicted  nucleic acid-binding Zn-ribbon protein